MPATSTVEGHCIEWIVAEGDNGGHVQLRTEAVGPSLMCMEKITGYVSATLFPQGDVEAEIFGAEIIRLAAAGYLAHSGVLPKPCRHDPGRRQLS